MSDTHLFLLVPNDSGSTWLQNIISKCASCVSFPTGLDGKGAVGDNTAYPNQEINKLFSEERERWQDPEEYRWDVIKRAWIDKWHQDPKFLTAHPAVLLEKTPQAIYAADMLKEQFNNVRFVISIRDPYAVVEGMRRTIASDIRIERYARHWVECAKQQITNVEKYRDISVVTTYEDIVNGPSKFEDKLRDLIPELHDIDLGKDAAAHSMDGGIASRKLIDYNQKHIDNLSAKDIAGITSVLRQEINVLNYFGYHLKD